MRRIFLATSLTGPIALVGVAAAQPEWQLASFLVWVATVLPLSLCFEAACPRCRKRFHGSRWVPNLTTTCRHCGLGAS